jgi:hypothetical protein
MPLWYILSIPKCKNIFRSPLKLHLMSLKLIVFQYNSFTQTSKIYKNPFFPSFPRPIFQNVITHRIFEILWYPLHRIFEILWYPLHRIFCTWYTLIKHINIDIWKKWHWLGFPSDGYIICSLGLSQNVLMQIKSSRAEFTKGVWLKTAFNFQGLNRNLHVLCAGPETEVTCI